MEVPLSICHIFPLFNADDNTLHGPVFLQEPNSMIFPLDSEEKKVKLSCEVKGNPRPTIGFVECLTIIWQDLHAYSSNPRELLSCIMHYNSVMPLEPTTVLIRKRKDIKKSLRIAVQLLNLNRSSKRL